MEVESMGDASTSEAGGTAQTSEASHTSETSSKESGNEQSSSSEGSSSEVSSGEASETNPDGTAAKKVEAYKPTGKYKAYGVEKEFPENIKKILTSKEVEDVVRDLAARADGLDEMKPKYERVREEFNKVKSEHQSTQQTLQTWNKMVREGDFDSLFQSAQIPEQAVLSWVYRKLKEAELPPEQQAILQQNRQVRMRAEQLEAQNQGLNSSFTSQMAQMRNIELNTVLSRSDVSQFAQTFDKRMAELGKQTNFRSEVIKRGYLVSQERGEDVPAEQAVQEVMQLMGGVVPQAQSQMPTQNMQGVQAQNTPPPVIPNVAGRGASPTKKVMKSLADLKKAAAQMD